MCSAFGHKICNVFLLYMYNIKNYVIEVCYIYLIQLQNL